MKTFINIKPLRARRVARFVTSKFFPPSEVLLDLDVDHSFKSQSLYRGRAWTFSKSQELYIKKKIYLWWLAPRFAFLGSRACRGGGENWEFFQVPGSLYREKCTYITTLRSGLRSFNSQRQILPHISTYFHIFLCISQLFPMCFQYMASETRFLWISLFIGPYVFLEAIQETPPSLTNVFGSTVPTRNNIDTAGPLPSTHYTHSVTTPSWRT